jgi:phage regulator Rha-like protein
MEDTPHDIARNARQTWRAKPTTGAGAILRWDRIATLPGGRSVDVARDFGKRHDNVLQVIDRLIALDEGARLRFQPSEYRDPTGRALRCFLMDTGHRLRFQPTSKTVEMPNGGVRQERCFLMDTGHRLKFEPVDYRDAKGEMLISMDTGARLKFQPSSYLAENGKMERCFLMDEATFSVLIPKLSGKLPLEWLIKYTQAFAAMKAHIQSVGKPDAGNPGAPRWLRTGISAVGAVWVAWKLSPVLRRPEAPAAS